MGGTRGDLALRQLAPDGLRQIGIATGFGVIGGLLWKFAVADPNRAAIAKVNQVRACWLAAPGKGWLGAGGAVWQCCASGRCRQRGAAEGQGLQCFALPLALGPPCLPRWPCAAAAAAAALP